MARRGNEPSFSEFVFSDLARYRPNEKPNWIRVLARCLVLPGMLACVILRAQQCLFRAGHTRLANVVRMVANIVVGADFYPGMTIGRGLLLTHPLGVHIGNQLTVGDGVTILQGVTVGTHDPTGRSDATYATICDGAILSANAVVIGGVRIGKHAMVGANSVVLSDVPDYAVVFGVPARQISSREAEVTATETPPGADS